MEQKGLETNNTTSEYILKIVSPLFNKHGYVGTSLSDLTKATGLTKGAIYCNFENKEDLAVKAFEQNVRQAIIPLFKLIEQKQNSVDKLCAITQYHRNYYQVVKGMGGCPMLRVGVDTKYNNPILFRKAKKLSGKFLKGLTKIIADGIDNNEIKENTDACNMAQLMLSIIEGSSLLAFTHNDESFLINTMEYIDHEIINQIRI